MVLLCKRAAPLPVVGGRFLMLFLVQKQAVLSDRWEDVRPLRDLK